MKKTNFFLWIISVLLLFGLGYYTGVKVQPKVDKLKDNYHKVVDGVFDTDSVKVMNTDTTSKTNIKVSTSVTVKAPEKYDTLYSTIYDGVFLFNPTDSICVITGTSDGDTFTFTLHGITQNVIVDQAFRDKIIDYGSNFEEAYNDGLDIKMVPGKRYTCSKSRCK